MLIRTVGLYAAVVDSVQFDENITLSAELSSNELSKLTSIARSSASTTGGRVNKLATAKKKVVINHYN